EDGIRDFHVTEFRRVLFRSIKDEALNSLEWQKVKDSVRHLYELISELLTELTDYSNPDEDTTREIRAQRFEIEKRHQDLHAVFRSEERRVGKECRSRLDVWE